MGFSFFFITGSVLWFTLAADQSKSGQCGHIDEELQVLGRRCTHKELRDLKKKKKKQKKRTDRQTEIERQRELTVSFLSVHHPLAQEESGSSS